MASPGMLRLVALVKTDVSEELSTSLIKVARISEIGTTLAVTSNRRTLRRNTKSFCCIHDDCVLLRGTDFDNCAVHELLMFGNVTLRYSVPKIFHLFYQPMLHGSFGLLLRFIPSSG
jgi:hypothetical protein